MEKIKPVFLEMAAFHYREKVLVIEISGFWDLQDLDAGN